MGDTTQAEHKPGESFSISLGYHAKRRNNYLLFSAEAPHYQSKHRKADERACTA